MITISEAGPHIFAVQGACVDIEYIVLSMMENNTYVITDGTATIVVDPSTKAPRLIEYLDGRTVDAIMLTHCHFDHIGAAHDLREATGAPVIASAVDADSIEHADEATRRPNIKPCIVDRPLDDGEVFEVGNMKWKSLLTPGHTPGCMCWFLDAQDGNNTEGAPVLISGDVLFCGTTGRTDFDGSDPQAMVGSIARLSELPDPTLVLPGHNNLTTIGDERLRVFSRFV